MLANRVRMGAGGGSSKIYGVEIDETNSDPLTSVVYTDAAKGFTPASGGNGNFTWGSWEDIIKNDFAIRPCVLTNGTGEVNYYLDYDDYTKKTDGTASKLTGYHGDVMVEFGVPLWWKFERTGTKLKIQLANNEFNGAIKPAFEIENGYNLVSIYQLFLTQILYLLMFKSLDSQTALGRGRVGASDSVPGATNTKTFCYGTTDDNDDVKFLGIEDYWSNRRWWIDGCYFSPETVMIGKSSFNDKGNGYAEYDRTITSLTGGFIDKVEGGNHTGFIPASIGGSESQYYCDYCFISGWQFPLFGGHAGSTASYAGGFSLTSATTSSANSYDCGRLSYSRDNKIYIGAYLGRIESNKLRSRSGLSVSTGVTITVFRIRAKANNT